MNFLSARGAQFAPKLTIARLLLNFHEYVNIGRNTPQLLNIALRSSSEHRSVSVLLVYANEFFRSSIFKIFSAPNFNVLTLIIYEIILYVNAYRYRQNILKKFNLLQTRFISILQKIFEIYNIYICGWRRQGVQTAEYQCSCPFVCLNLYPRLNIGTNISFSNIRTVGCGPTKLQLVVRTMI